MVIWALNHRASPCHHARLLQVSPEEARRVICAPKEVVEEFQEEVRSPTGWLVGHLNGDQNAGEIMGISDDLAFGHL